MTQKNTDKRLINTDDDPVFICVDDNYNCMVSYEQDYEDYLDAENQLRCCGCYDV